MLRFVFYFTVSFLASTVRTLIQLALLIGLVLGIHILVGAFQ